MSQEIKYPAPEDITRLHDDILDVTGGKSGTLIKDYPSTMLYSLYYQDHSDLCNGAAFILSRLAKTHPYADGNKRTAYFAARYFLMLNGADFNGSSIEEAAEEVNQVAARPTIDDAFDLAKQLCRQDLIEDATPIRGYHDFYRLVIKSIGVAEKLSKM